MSSIDQQPNSADGAPAPVNVPEPSTNLAVALQEMFWKLAEAHEAVMSVFEMTNAHNDPLLTPELGPQQPTLEKLTVNLGWQIDMGADLIEEHAHRLGYPKSIRP